MEFFEVIRRRRAVRAFENRAIPAEALELVLQTANAAPSACNLQAYEIYVVTGERRRAELAAAARQQRFVAAAPVVLVFCTNVAHGDILFAIQDAAIAATCAMLAATAQGLATVWVGSFEAAEVASIIGAPAGIAPVALMPLGYAAEEPPQQPRRRLEDLVHREP
jgi:nitroreductase